MIIVAHESMMMPCYLSRGFSDDKNNKLLGNDNYFIIISSSCC